MSARKYATLEDLSAMNAKIDAILAMMTAKPSSLPEETPKVKPEETPKAKPEEAPKAKPEETPKEITFDAWNTLIVRPYDGQSVIYVSPHVDISKASQVVFDALKPFRWYATVNRKGEQKRRQSTKFYPHYSNGSLAYWVCYVGVIDSVNQTELRAALKGIKPKLVKYTPKAEPVKAEPVKETLSFAV